MYIGTQVHSDFEVGPNNVSKDKEAKTKQNKTKQNKNHRKKGRMLKMMNATLEDKHVKSSINWPLSPEGLME